MSGNSQFQRLRQEVKELRSELAALRGNTPSAADFEAQRAMLQNARQQQAAAKQVVANPLSTADELEAAMPFLPSLGLKEQARLDSQAKRDQEQMAHGFGQPLIQNTQWVESAQRAQQDGTYLTWRDVLSEGSVPLTPSLLGALSPAANSGVSPNAMRAAQALSRNQEVERRLVQEQKRDVAARQRQLGSTEKAQASSMPTPLSRFFEE